MTALGNGTAANATDPPFCLYYDEAMTRPTPYSSNGDYFKVAQGRMDRTFEIIEDKVQGKDILDIGASPFYLLYRAGRSGAASCHGTYFANDAHPLKNVDHVYAPSGSIEIHHSNIEADRLPFDDDSFDVVTACEVLEHLEHFPTLFAAEVRRILRPGGLLCVTVPNVSRIANIVKLMLRKNIYMPYRADVSGRHKHEYTGSQLKALVGYMGLDVVESGTIAYSTSPQPFMRPINRFVGSVPGLRAYAPVLYVLARQHEPKPSTPLGPPPKALYTEALSIEE